MTLMRVRRVALGARQGLPALLPLPEYVWSVQAPWDARDSRRGVKRGTTDSRDLRAWRAVTTTAFLRTIAGGFFDGGDTSAEARRSFLLEVLKAAPADTAAAAVDTSDAEVRSASAACATCDQCRTVRRRLAHRGWCLCRNA